MMSLSLVASSSEIAECVVVYQPEIHPVRLGGFDDVGGVFVAKGDGDGVKVGAGVSPAPSGIGTRLRRRTGETPVLL